MTGKGKASSPDAYASLLFASAGCNRVPGALSSLPSLGLAAYAAKSNVFIVAENGRCVCAALPVHRAPVNGVQLVHTKRAVFLVAVAADGSSSVWRCAHSTNTNDWSDWTLSTEWKAHNGTVVAVDAIWNDANNTLAVATAGMDAKLKVWCIAEEKPVDQCVLEYDLNNLARLCGFLPECLALCPATGKDEAQSPEIVFIALGGTTRTLHVFAMDLEFRQLSYAFGLAGHRDWIRSVAFSAPCRFQENSAFFCYLASASMDSTVRVWSLSRSDAHFAKNTSASEEALLAESSVMLAAPRATYLHGEATWVLSAVALLEEHSMAVQSVSFETCPAEHDQSQPPRILSSSMDCSVALWKAAPEGPWRCTSRFGLLGGAGAHALGFFGAVFLSVGVNDVLGHNFGGALHCWRRRSSAGISALQNVDSFFADIAPGGHSDVVHDVDWDLNADFLLTCSQDKSARIYMKQRTPKTGYFVEWARPQIHGHSIFAIAFCDKGGLKYVSGAEERMLRLFEAPMSFKHPDSHWGNGSRQADATSAFIPELGLSNKAVYKTNADVDSDLQGQDAHRVTSFGAERSHTTAPLEEELKQSTIWPETGKLYGHGNEISCVAVNLKRGLLASACRAQKAANAEIRFWDIESGAEHKQVHVHELTVTQMEFSPDGTRLLSVSRDRSFAVLRNGPGRFDFVVLVNHKAAHTRLI